MASPQIENGYLKIANELMEALLKTRISGEARQIFDSILRQTYGFHKKSDQIATTRFMELTGLGRSAVHKARRKLLKMNLISVSQKGYSKGLTYSIQKDYHKWQVLPKKDTVSQKVYRCIPKGIQGVSQKGHEVYPKKRPTKDRKILLKDTNIKDSATIVARDYFYFSYKQAFNQQYIANFGKDGRIFKELLAVIPLEELKTLIDRFFTSGDKFIKEAGFTTGVFKSQVNKLRGKNGADKDDNRKGNEYAGVETEIEVGDN